MPPIYSGLYAPQQPVAAAPMAGGPQSPRRQRRVRRAAEAQAAAAQAPGAAQGFNPQFMFQDFQKKYDTARGANEQRYADVLGGYRDRYDTGMKTLENMGQQELSDVRDSWRDRGAQAQSQLAGLGMAGTTIAPTMAAGNQRDANADAGRVNERLRRERLGYGGQFSKDTLDFMERRTDEYPDIGMYANLAMQMGQGGMGGGAGGAGGMGGVGGVPGGYAGGLGGDRTSNYDVIGDPGFAAAGSMSQKPPKYINKKTGASITPWQYNWLSQNGRI